MKAQADRVRTGESQEHLLTALFVLNRKEVIPYLRQYIDNEKELIKKATGFDDYDWETRGWMHDGTDFIRNKSLYEAVRVLHALGGELTDREKDHLSRLGIIGDAKQTIAKEDLYTGVAK